MTLRDVMRTALGNLARHKARTVLTMVGVIVGILTIVTMVSLGNGVRAQMRTAFDAVGIESIRLYPTSEDVGDYSLFGQRPRTRLLTPELVGALQARDDVVEVVPYLNLADGLRATIRLGGQEVEADLRAPRPGTARDPFELPVRTLAGAGQPPAEGGAVVVSANLIESLGYERDEVAGVVGRAAELVLYAPRGESETFPVEIAGVTTEQWGDLTLADVDRLAMLEWWYNDPDYLAHRGYDEVLIRTHSLNDAVHIVDWLDAQGYEVQSIKMMVDLANRGMTILTTMLGSVGGLALLVASIGIANTMIMSVYERTKEIGILKAVGASPAQIRALFVVEASLIGLMGGVVGTILGWLLCKGLNWLLLEILAWQDVPMEGTFFVLTWWLVAGALAFATLVGLLAGLYPAARAARLVPLDALRYE
ncbi:MAG: ABC transporter permease [Anaerolineae bacterium]|nr:ABC transporter permease [Anaerolineae bacterium]